MSVQVCTCCRVEHTALHTHDNPCEKHSLAPVVPQPPSLSEPGGEDCTGPITRAAILAAYRARGGVALGLALRQYREPHTK